MDLDMLHGLIDQALKTENPAIVEFCHPWYSPYYQLLYLLADHFHSELAVELGVETGRGSFSLLQGGTRVIGVEQNKDRADVLRDHSNFQMLVMSSTPVPQLIRDAGKIAILHIDTEHSFSQVEVEFNAYKPYLQDGAVVLFDDTNAMEGDVRRFVESLPYEKFFDDRLHPTCGFGGLIYKE